MDQLSRTLNDALERRGLSAAAASQAAVGNPSAIKNILALLRRKPGERATALQNLATIADYLGLELQLGLPPSNHNKAIKKDVKCPKTEDFAFVDRFDVKLSAGPGSNGDNARKLAPVAFRRQWLSENGLKPDNCVVTGVSGNSMEPMLFDGDLVLLNRNRVDLRSGQVYGIVDIEGDVRIKRIERIEEGIILRSENPNCPSELRLGDDANRVRIIGALAWSGHTHDTRRIPTQGAPAPTTFKHNWL